MFFFLVEYCNVICFYNLVWLYCNHGYGHFSAIFFLGNNGMNPSSMVLLRKMIKQLLLKHIKIHLYLLLSVSCTIRSTADISYRNETTYNTQILCHLLNSSCFSMVSSLNFLIFLFSQGINSWKFLSSYEIASYT